jgi:hypothetical protein
MSLQIQYFVVNKTCLYICKILKVCQIHLCFLLFETLKLQLIYQTYKVCFFNTILLKLYDEVGNFLYLKSILIILFALFFTYYPWSRLLGA